MSAQSSLDSAFQVTAFILNKLTQQFHLAPNCASCMGNDQEPNGDQESDLKDKVI